MISANQRLNHKFGVMDKKNGILEMFRSSGQKEWCLFLAVSSNFIQTYYFCFVK